MKWLEKLKDGRREQILILLLSGILLLVIALPSDSPLPVPPSSENEESAASGGTWTTAAQAETAQLERKLQQILGTVEGIGKTNVMITLKSDGRQIVEKDREQQEQQDDPSGDGSDGSSSQKSSREATVYQKDSRGNELPYVSETLTPEIAGVLVSAQGGGNAVIVKEITEAVMALFGVEAHKIKVMKME